MLYTIRKSFLVTISILTVTAQARLIDIVGNGGDVLVCQSGQVELLDFYEQRQRGGTIDSTQIINNPYYQVEAILNKLSNIDSSRADRLRKRFQEMKKNITFVDYDLSEIFDAGLILELPSSCRLTQIARQFIDASKTLKVEINKKLWNQLNTENQRGLLMHELVYKDFLDQGQENSINTRFYNAFINDLSFSSIKSSDYRVTIERLGLNELNPLKKIKDISDFLDKNLIGKTFIRETKDQVRNQGKAIANVRRVSSFSRPVVSKQRLKFTIRNQIHSTRWDLDSNGDKIIPGLKTRRIIITEYVVNSLKSFNKIKIQGYPVLDSDPNSNRGIIVGELKLHEDNIEWDIRSAGISDYRKTNTSFVPGKTFANIKFTVLGDGKVRKDSKIEVYEVSHSDLEPINLLQSYNLTSFSR